MPEFLEGLTQRVHAEHEDLLEKIRGGDWSDETQQAVDKAVAEFAEDFGYDLDEEGQPTDEAPRRRVGEALARNGGRPDDDGSEDRRFRRGDDAEEEQEEKETAAASP